ncbi:MAG TPA: hypothetical protein VIY73_07720 [Polyangiaceae bacterium]
MRRALAAFVVLAAVGTVCPASRADTPGTSAGRPDAVVARSPPVVEAPHVDLVDDGQGTLPTFFHEGRRFVLGTVGDRYRIRVVNPTASRIEAVVSVDGLDAIDGSPASTTKRGYVVPAFGVVTIDGWRTSLDTVAAFRFSSVRDSYAARQQRPANVGVVGVAFFRERPPIAWRPPPVGWRGTAPSASAGGAGEPPSPPRKADRDGLGTRFGEAHDSHVDETSFVRASATASNVSELRYDDRQGLLARGIVVPTPWDGRRVENDLRDEARPFPNDRFAHPPR